MVTSAGEGSPLFVQEVLAAGVPLVATAVAGVADLVGAAAVLVPAGDVDALDAAVRALLDRPGPAGRAGRGRTGPGRAPGRPRPRPWTRSGRLRGAHRGAGLPRCRRRRRRRRDPDEARDTSWRAGLREGCYREIPWIT